MSTFELGSDGVGEMDDFEDGSVHSNLSSSDTIELAEKVLLKSALKMQKDAQDKLMQRGKKEVVKIIRTTAKIAKTSKAQKRAR